MSSHSSGSTKVTVNSGPSTAFPRAIVYWSSEKKSTEPRDAWISISTSVRWVFVESDDPAPLLDFSSFRGQYCLLLERLQELATWEDVEEKVKPIDDQRGPVLVVPGKLSGRDVPLFMRHHVKLTIICDTIDERNALMDGIRIRISPWQLLHRRMKEVLLDARLSDKALNTLFFCAEKSCVPVPSNFNEKPSTFVEAVTEGAPVLGGLDLLSGFVETVATVVKKSVPVAKDVAEEVADFAKCVTVVSSALQVVVMCATLAEMGMEMRRGTAEWPRIRAQVEDLRGAVVKSMIPMLHPDGQVNELLVKNVFEVQQELVDLLGSAEKEMMRDSGTIQSVKRFWKSSELKRIEGELGRLKGCVLEVIQSSSIAKNSKTLEEIRRTVEELKQNACVSSDVFKPYFDSPYLPSNLVFDFESRDNNGSYITPEGILLSSVLQLRKKSLQGASALGTHGMGGVGKTTALKKICHNKTVRSSFPDGLYFMQFGQDATIQKVSGEICCCVRNFGGVNAAKEMKSAPNLTDVVNRAAEWLKGRSVLLVCDDLWASGDNELGFVHELKKMLRYAPRSSLLISTRDRAIARAVASSPVSFEALESRGSKAKEILGIAAFGPEWQNVMGDWDAESEYEQILDVCAGLPLALGIAGSGVNIDYEDSEDPSFAVQNYWEGLREGGLEHLQGANAEYHADGLKYVVQASLKLCEVWGRAGGRNYDMRSFFRSLCVLEKQQSIPESTLKLFWGLGKRQVSEVVRKFANLNIAKREVLDRSASKNRQFCLHLHDLVLELCKEMEVDEQERWHTEMINAYRLTLGYVKVTETCPVAWWNVQDDGYVSGNLSRHLVASGCCLELEALLSDVRWTLRRYEIGGWAALHLDFKRLLDFQSGMERNEVRKLYILLKRCWDLLHRDQSLFAFNVFGHLSKRERRDRKVSQYLTSVAEHFPSPWLYPMTKCVGPEDNREQSRWNIGSSINDLEVSWSSDRVAIASHEGVHVWSLTRQEELFIIPGKAFCVAMPENGKLIISGHRDGTVRRWCALSGEAIGEPMTGHTEEVNSVAARGNLIVSGSSDSSLYRWDTFTGEAIGCALQGHEDSVCSTAISADGKLIVSSSSDRTVRRWNATTGEPVGCPLRGHCSAVTSLAISSNSELIVSGSDDKTVRRWKASTGEAIGEPLLGHNDEITSLAISEDGKCIVSSSDDHFVRVWDASSGEAIGFPLQGHEEVASGVAINRDGTLVLSGSWDKTIRQWDLAARSEVSEDYEPTMIPEGKSVFGEESVLGVAVCSDGKLAVSGAGDNTVRRWDVMTGEAVGRPILGHTGRFGVYSVAISRDGALIATGGSDNLVRRWDASTGEAIGEPMVGHTDIVRAVVISDDGKLIVTGAEDRTVRIWDSKTGKPIGKSMGGHTGRIADLAISTDGSVIIAGTTDSVQRWNSQTGEKIGDPIVVRGWAENVVISNDGKTIGCGSSVGNHVQLWDTMTGKRVGKRMKWKDAQHVLDGMKRARLCGDGKCDAVVRKDIFPVETECRAVCPDVNKVVLGLRNGRVVVCERR